MRKILLLNFLVLLFPFLGTAQSNDATFNIADTISGFNNSVHSIVVQPDGKILVGGNFTNFNGNSVNNIARLNTDGTLDNSFTIGAGFNQTVHTIAIQTDGKILVGGRFTSFNGSTANLIVRLNTNGTLDNSYTTGTEFNGIVYSIVVQPDGKILVGGDLPVFNGSSVNNIARLNTDGTLDNSFTTGTGFNQTVYTIAIQTDGKVLVGGILTSFNGNTVGRIARLNTDGTLDNSFTIGTGFNKVVNSIALQSDGKILVGGQFTSFNGSTVNRIVRLNTDGTLDNSFTIGTGFEIKVNSIAILTNGKILVGGSFTSYNGSTVNRIARLNTDGTLDNSFTIGLGFSFNVESIALQTDGKILVGGQFTSFNGNSVGNIARLNAVGTIDNSFALVTGFDKSVKSIALQSDGKILVGGDFTSFNGSSVNFIVRLNTDGTLDNSFTIGTGFNQAVETIALQTDGKIIVGGDFTSYNGSTVNRIARLNSNGTLDNSFTIGTGFSNQVWSVAVQSDGKILVGGEFTSYNGNTVNRIARLNTNGTLDNSFTTGSGFIGKVWSVVVQSDGKILVGGHFTSFNGIPVNNFVRLNSNGTVDNSFAIGTSFNNDVKTIVQQPDGKVLVGGSFTSYNASSVNKIARLNTDGTLDNSFIIGTGFYSGISSVKTIALLTDGKILVGGGDFSVYSGIPVNNIVRLNTGGTLDKSFVIGKRFNQLVNSIVLQSDGKILVGGDFVLYNGISRNNIVRLMNCILATGTFTHDTCNSYIWIDGIEYTTSNNTATHTIVGGAISGCDSIVTLNLTITPINTSVTQANEVLTSQETGATYQWIDCSNNSPIAGANNASFTATSNGSYAVKVTKSSCTDTSTCYNVTTLGVENLSAKSNKLYPNPVTDILTIESQGNVKQVELYSITGQLLQTIKPQSNVIEVDVTSFGSGVYIVKIENNDGNSTTNRVVKK